MEKDIMVTRSSMPKYDDYIEAIRPLWDSCWLTNMGVYHQKLENKLQDILNVPYLSLMVNGHMALELAIQSMHLPASSEVITTPFTFISTTHAILRNNLIPVFCDVKESNGTIDPDKIEELITEKTSAIMPVHVYGNICDIKKIQDIANKYSLKVIYDAAHAFGETYQGHGVGNYGDASVFSFHATKVFHTIEGGAVAIAKKELYDKLYNLKNFGIRDTELVVDVGANAKMNEFSAIMGLCNLKNIKSSIAKRQIAYKQYKKRLRNISSIRFLIDENTENRNYAYLPIIVEDRDKVYDFLISKRVFARKYFYPLTCDQVCFRNKYKKSILPIARDLSAHVLTLPLYEELNSEDIDFICNIIKSYL